MEPLASLIREAIDAEGLSQADVMRLTGLKRQHLSQLLNRRERYRSRPPKTETLQALAKVPGLSIERIADAVAESTGMPRPNVDYSAQQTPLRRSVHSVVDKIPEGELNRALQVLVALLS
jgi:transcriptional regulator with XRE-family HTH domain